MSAELWPYLVVILVGFLPTEFWRLVGVLLARRINENSEVLVWVRAVATALLAGVVAKILVGPTGALAQVPIWLRVAAVGLGLAGYFTLRRSVIAGVLVGEIGLIGASALLSGS